MVSIFGRNIIRNHTRANRLVRCSISFDFCPVPIKIINPKTQNLDMQSSWGHTEPRMIETVLQDVIFYHIDKYI